MPDIDVSSITWRTVAEELQRIRDKAVRGLRNASTIEQVRELQQQIRLTEQLLELPHAKPPVVTPPVLPT